MGPCVRRDDRNPAYEIPISSPAASSRFQMTIWPPLPARLPQRPPHMC